MSKLSAGLLIYRVTVTGKVEVLLVHPGGPFWSKKDDGAWSLPKGEYLEGEDARAVALREFIEELSLEPPRGDEFSLGQLKQPSGKRVTAWAVEGDIDVTAFSSNTFEMEWPRGSGGLQSFPEIDRAEWFSVAEGRSKLLKGQVEFLDRLMAALNEQCDAIELSEGDNCDEPPIQSQLF
jgi:predicted NUDIX family NTP pyrophosphohydrolase